MSAYWLDWMHLLLRWSHFIVGVAWIGASFYFIWLDNHLEAVVKESDRDEGVGGEFGHGLISPVHSVRLVCSRVM